MRQFQIGNHRIGGGGSPYVIAEAGANHEGDMCSAERMIDEAAAAGAHAIKFQTYKAERLVTRRAPRYWTEEVREPGDEDLQIHTFRKYDQFSEEDWRRLAARCRGRGLTFLSSGWDEASIDLLDSLGVPAFKVGSADITTLPLLRHIAAKGKPVILSTGASTIGEIEQALAVILAEGNEQVALLHCVLSYPTQFADANLGMIKVLADAFPEMPIGYSDHTHTDPCMTVCLSAAALGACIVEKHYTLDRSLPGNDHYHSMEPADLARLTCALQIQADALGAPEDRILIKAERAAKENARRSLVTRVSIPAGRKIERDLLTYKRPGTGISPADMDKVIGRVAQVDIEEDTTLTWEMV